MAEGGNSNAVRTITEANLKALVDTQVTSSLQKSNASLLSDLDKLVSGRLNVLKNELTESQASISENQISLMQQMKANERPVFKKRGNEEQFKHNQKVACNLESIGRIAEATSKDSTQSAEPMKLIQEQVVEGMNTINHRQKLIRLADSSEMGWKVIDEYEANELAENSDDEKRIIKAQIRASKKHKDLQIRKRKRAARSWNSSTIVPSQQPEQGTSRQVNRPITTLPATGVKPGTCFACGRPGHWRGAPECPASGQASTKISDFLISKPIAEFTEADVNSETIGLTTEISSILCKHRFSYSNGSIQYNKLSSDVAETPQQQQRCFEGPWSCDASLDITDVLGIHQQPEITEGCSPVGRLFRSIKEWEHLGACTHVLEVLKQGYKLPFFNLPTRVKLPNNRSALCNSDFVASEISKLLKIGAISEVSSDEIYVINPLSVATHNRTGKQRLVLDCRHINPCLFKFKFCCEDTGTARLMFETGDYLFKFDIKAAFHHIDIFPDHRPYLGCSFVINGREKYFIFNVLAFGISTAPYIFTKIMRAVVTHWRSIGYRIVIFYDDGIGGAKGLKDAAVLSSIIRKDLYDLGFLLSENKCSWEPVPRIEWLGTVLDMNVGKLFVTEDRITRLLSDIKAIMQNIATGYIYVKARHLASIAGQILSLQGAVGPITRLRTRFIYSCIETKASWQGLVKLSQLALGELEFWQSNLSDLNGQSLVTTNESSLCVYSDASNTGYGGYIVDIDGSDTLGQWTLEESLKSSTWRELEAVLRILKCHERGMKGQVVQWFTDNQNVVRILQCGSVKEELQHIALGVHQVYLKIKQSVRHSLEEESFSNDPIFRELGEKMSTYIPLAKSDSTNKKYRGHFVRFRAFLAEKGVSALPATPISVALFLTHLLNVGTSYSVISSFVYAIKWAHSLSAHQDPTTHPFVQNLLEASKRQPKHPKVKKDIIHPDDLKELCRRYQYCDDLIVLRDLSMILLSFSGFLRFSELSQLRCSDITLHDDFLSINIQKSKTDQYRDGSTIVIAKGDSVACPVSMYQRYVTIAGCTADSNHFLFKPVYKSYNKSGLVNVNKSISYTRTRECIISRLKEVVDKDINIGLHSLRASGATAAANSSVNERCWKRHGRWKSDSAKDGYVKDSLIKKLEVSKSLGL